ncbi:MAG: rubredoxin [Neptuniibacter sp.]|uniref:rubredoxin n=1 Tax=Neptuniibacter sp. TaxID=1962643 RepID=UPI003B5B8BFB
MSYQGFEGSYLGDANRIDADVCMECKICWYQYDPKQGDAVWQIPSGTAFSDLPEFWRCPECDGEKDQFMVLEG